MKARIRDRTALHRRAVGHVLGKLKRRGVLAVRASRRDHADVLVDGRAVCIRAARISVRPHRVRVNGKVYRYCYANLQWNLHRHGRRVCPPPDSWVFCAPSAHLWCIVPDLVLRGRLTLLVQWPIQKHWIREYRDKWEGL